MPIDTDKIDEAVLALLHLTLHDGSRAWKGHDWEALNRLHRKGMIGDPISKAKSVGLTGGWRRVSVCSKSYSRRCPDADVVPLAGSAGKLIRASDQCVPSSADPH